MNADEQEALSRKYSDDVILLLPLKSGCIAVFNNARELCGIMKDDDPDDWPAIMRIWHRSKQTLRPAIDLTELGLL